MRKPRFILLALALALSACQAATPPAETQAPTAAVQPTGAPAETSAPAQGSTAPAGSEDFVCQVVQSLPDPYSPAEVGLPPITEDDHILGPDDALITLVEYSDFECPYCALAAGELDALMAAYPDDVRLVYRHLPLESIHDKANLAARASEAAGLQGKFWEMYHAIFSAAREQVWTGMTVDQFTDWLEERAVELNLDANRFASDMQSEAVKQAVQSSTDTAFSIGLSGTPSIFIMVGDQVLFHPADGLPWDSRTLTAVVELTRLQEKQFDACPEQVLEEGKEYTAVLKTSRGDVTLRLFAEEAPVTVNSFVFLANHDYFDNVPFHRVLPGFVAQTGDPTGTGYGGPGYEFRNEIVDGLVFDRAGLVAMANSGPDSNGSQFFITYGPAENLNGGYTIFGEVIEGMDVVESLTPRNPQDSGPLPDPDLLLDVIIEVN